MVREASDQVVVSDVVSSVLRVTALRANRRRIAGDFGGMRSVVASVMRTSGVLSGSRREGLSDPASGAQREGLRAESVSGLSHDLLADPFGRPSRVRSSELKVVASSGVNVVLLSDLSVVRSDVPMRDRVVDRRVRVSLDREVLRASVREVEELRGPTSLERGFSVVRVNLPAGVDRREIVECRVCGFWW